MSNSTVKTASPIVFFAFGLFIIFTTWSKVRPGYEAGQWPVANGVILGAEVQKVVGDGEETYEPILKYSYQVNGVKRTSALISYDSHATSFKSREEAGAFLSRYPIGAETAVRYNPGKPEESALIPGYDKQQLIPLGIGVLFLVWGMTIFRKTQKLTAGINTENKETPNPTGQQTACGQSR